MHSKSRSSSNALTQFALGSAAGIYRLVTSVRNRLFDCGIFSAFIAQLPVICVGNITVGGTGKTPLVRYLVQQLRLRGETPVILSRGYGGRRSGPWQVQPEDTFTEVGDEPVMLSQDRNLPVVIARSRVAGAKYIQERRLGSVILLDDGFQHRWLGRDVDIVCVNVATPAACVDFVAGEMLPLGPFRECRKAGLKRATLLVLSSRTPEVVNRQSPSVAKVIESLPPRLAWTTSSLGEPVVQRTASGERLPIQSITAVCGIANPEGFFFTLNQLGFTERSDIILPDHSARLEQVCRRSLSENALPIVMSEKDAMRLPADLLAHDRINILRVQLVLDDPELLMQTVDKALSARRA